ncbi:MAG: protein kinase [Polyangiaceae bacterium]|nr:protein kinase [Polyangiaceae bacterium]
MKACPSCGRLYPDDAGFCPVDGAQLQSATQVPIAPDDQDARVGQVLCSRYQVRRVVADGGMGRVYEALDLYERRNVALKVLHPDVARDEVAVERFRREFEVSKMLPHAHIVEVLDFQPSDGTFVLVMEFLYGEELRAMLKRESVMVPARIVRMLSQIALGLDEAHERKLVHRDLKPDNVFLCQTNDGDIVKLLDFGSVKDKKETAKKLTVLGTTIGSPYYMAPEQAQGLETLDHRADVWAMAAIAYECVTGTVPFKGANGPSILLEILTKEPVAPSKASAALRHPAPPGLDRVMAHAFKKAPGMRIGSVGALADVFGQAYGLTGDHRAWAVAPEAALGQAIDARLPALMTAQPEAPRADVADSFFGEMDALDGFAGAPPGAAPPPAAGQQAWHGAPAAPVPSGAVEPFGAGIPANSNKGLLILVAVGVGALVLGAVVLILFLL